MKKIIALLLILTFSTELTAFASAAGVSARLRDVQEEDIELNADAFSDNYQPSVQTAMEPHNLSPIEKLFNGKESEVTGTPLRQIGYDLFTSTSSSVNGTAGKFDGNYRLSIGEKVNVYLYGDSIDVMAISGTNLLHPTTRTEVDSKGYIFVQGIGLVKAENRSIAEVEGEVNRMASQKFKSLKVKLTVATGQEFSVFVYGQVNRPGRILVGNNSSILDALNAAGGVKKTGTLRNITYSSNGKTRGVDLYKALFSGNDDGIILRPNDKIFVDKVGSVVAIKNGVTVPGIYEIKSGEDLQSIVTFAGGILPATQVTEVTLTGYDTASKQRTAENVAWNEAKTTKLKSGDSVEFRELYNMAENIVTIQGNVKHPTTYAYKEGMRLSDILKSEDELLQDLLDNNQVYEEEIDRASKTITIGNRVINYAIEAELTDIYVALYNDGTLVFSNKDDFDVGKIAEGWNIENIKEIHYDPFYGEPLPWFDYADQITKIEITSKIVPEYTNGWFMDCMNLTNIDLSNLDTSKVTDMSSMFNSCGLTSLDLSSFNTSNVTNMSGMFRGPLSSLDLSSFDTSKVTDMSYMFNRCSELNSLNISSFNTSNVTRMDGMFLNCSGLDSLDLRNFDTSKVTDMSFMFGSSFKLKKIYVSSKWTTANADTTHMFGGCGTSSVTRV